MARYVVTTAAQIAFISYLQPGRVVHKGEVLELSSAEVTALSTAGAALRAGSTGHDVLGESFAVSNSA